jgi:hypothetical protein
MNRFSVLGPVCMVTFSVRRDRHHVVDLFVFEVGASGSAWP